MPKVLTIDFEKDVRYDFIKSRSRKNLKAGGEFTLFSLLLFLSVYIEGLIWSFLTLRGFNGDDRAVSGGLKLREERVRGRRGLCIFILILKIQ